MGIIVVAFMVCMRLEKKDRRLATGFDKPIYEDFFESEGSKRGIVYYVARLRPNVYLQD